MEAVHVGPGGEETSHRVPEGQKITIGRIVRNVLCLLIFIFFQTADGKYGIPPKDNLVSRKQLRASLVPGKESVNILNQGHQPIYLCASQADIKNGELNLVVSKELGKGQEANASAGSYVLIGSNSKSAGPPVTFKDSSSKPRTSNFYVYKIASLNVTSETTPTRKRPRAASVDGDRSTTRTRAKREDGGSASDLKGEKVPENEKKKKENGPPAGFTEWVKGWKHGWGLQLPASDRSQSWAYMPVISRAIERYRTLWGVERLSVPMGCRDLSRRELQFWSQVEDFHECVELVIEAFKTIPIARSLVSETRNWDRKDHLKASIQNALGCIRVKLPQKGDGADEKLDSSPPKPRVQIISQSIQLMAARVLLWVNSVTPNPNPKPASSSAPPILQNTTQTSAPAKLNSEKNVENSAAEEISEVRISVGDGAKKRREAGERGGWRLGLPAISIGEMAFPGQKGAAICAAALKTFFLRYPDEKIEIVLVADPVRKPGAKVKAKKGDEGCEEFFNEISKILKEEKRVKLVRRGRIWKLNTDIDTPASFVVCLPNNWRFKGGQLSFEMNRAASTSKESLQKLTLRTHTRGAKVGRAYSVEVPAGCPLQDTEGGDTVIHALGPNLNKSLPDYIPEKLPEGREPPEQLLLQTYQSVLEEFAKFLHLPKPLPQAPQYALPTSGESEEKLFPADSAKFRYNAPPPLKGGNKGDWKSALLNYIKNPGENKESIFWKA
ncbi:hypothetical protein AAMO2058_000652700 [Amorphochlora amoebiformis]